ncbi:uncharacterized protein LOC111318522 [Durio zibethinus]|uniref:Uncharacterized protein LOC111318522 n=1 Tax=Durio zibethinus TaxID=66656 RepID=A0A6P6BJ76_DURZI|nr:uncharacterized protein LOC111318522 [Durio zibethinus]
MLSMSLDISFSGLLNCVLTYLTESVVSVLLELMDQDRASNRFETQTLDYMQLLQEILPRKKKEFASFEMELDSSGKKVLEFKNFKAASSTMHTTTSNQSRLKVDFSVDSIVKQENLFYKFRNEEASSSKEVVKKSGVIISQNEARISFCKGKVALQASEAEELNTRLKILEEEYEILKQAFLETVVERKELVNEIYQLFQTLRNSLHRKDQEDGHRTSHGSLIIKPFKVLHFDPLFNFCL